LNIAPILYKKYINIAVSIYSYILGQLVENEFSFNFLKPLYAKITRRTINVKLLRLVCINTLSTTPIAILTMSVHSLYNEYISCVEDIIGYTLPEDVFHRVKGVFMRMLTLKRPDAIIVGVIPNRYHLKLDRGNTIISTGMQNKRDSCPLREKMLDTLRGIMKENILLIRIPFVSTIDSTHVPELITAFDPVLTFILRKIASTNSGEFKAPIPILSLGKNSSISIHRAISKINYPSFVLLESVHPTYMTYANIKIKNTENKQLQDYLESKKEEEFNLFVQNVEHFLHMTQK